MHIRINLYNDNFETWRQVRVVTKLGISDQLIDPSLVNASLLTQSYIV